MDYNQPDNIFHDEKIVSGGGVNYVFGGAVDERRLQAWGREGAPVAGANDECVFAFYVKYFDVESNLNEFFRRLHDAIAKLYCVAILSADTGPEIVIKRAQYSSNYTFYTTLLRNISFPGATTVRGYCPHEPKVRILELLKYPIAQFGITLPAFTISRFDAPTVKFSEATFADVHDDLKAYEMYCAKLCKKIEAYISEVEALCAKINNFD